MEIEIPQFLVDRIRGGAVSKDGSMATIELAGGGQAIWITIPLDLLKSLATLAEMLDSLGCNAKSGLTNSWFVNTPPTSRNQ